MSENRTNDTLIAYDKNGNAIAQGVMGDGSVVIDNLKPATSYSAGDFMVAFSNKNGVSDKVAVPAFETKAVPTQPTSSASGSNQPTQPAVDPTSPASSQADKPVSSDSQPTEDQLASSASEVESEKPSQASNAESASSNSAQPASQAK